MTSSLSLLFITLCIALSTPLLHAEWNQTFLQSHSAYLEDRSQDVFADLKDQIAEELANSWCSLEKMNLLMDLVLETRPKVCVEVGAFTGASILPVASALCYLNFGKIYAVDAWSNTVAIRNLKDDDPNKIWWSSVDMSCVYQAFQNLMKKWSLEHFCVTICKSSDQAIDDIPEQIDFLHLDGDYSEIGSLHDVELYLPKVRRGGYILLSNFYLMIGREQPKIRAFCALCESCNIVATIERDNAVLFQKSNE